MCCVTSSFSVDWFVEDQLFLKDAEYKIHQNIFPDADLNLNIIEIN